MHQIPVSGDMLCGTSYKLPFSVFFPLVALAPHLHSIGAPGRHAAVPVWLEFGLHLKEKSIVGVIMKKKMKKKEEEKNSNSNEKEKNTRKGPGAKQ